MLRNYYIPFTQSSPGEKATALLFAKAGSNLVLLARRAEQLQQVVDAAKAIPGSGKVAGVQLDVSDKAQVASLWDKIPQELRAIDVLGMSIHELSYGAY